MENEDYRVQDITLHGFIVGETWGSGGAELSVIGQISVARKKYPKLSFPEILKKLLAEVGGDFKSAKFSPDTVLVFSLDKKVGNRRTLKQRAYRLSKAAGTAPLMQRAN